MRERRSVPLLCRNTDSVAVQPWPACRRLLCRTAYQWHPIRRHGRSRGRQQGGYADDDEKYKPHWYAKNFRCNEINDVKHSNPMRRQCQFTVKRSEKGVVLTVAAEQQPCGVQVVEWVGLVASGLQFTLCLAAVVAEEFGGFGMSSGIIQWCSAIKILLRIHIRTCGDE